MVDISNISGTSIANVSSINGIAKASISSFGGGDIPTGGGSPIVTTNLIHRWDFSNSGSITLNGSDVSQINDLVGSNNASQGSASLQPALISSAQNGLDVARPAAAEALALDSAINLGSTYTIFIAYKSNAEQTAAYLLGGATGEAQGVFGESNVATYLGAGSYENNSGGGTVGYMRTGARISSFGALCVTPSTLYVDDVETLDASANTPINFTNLEALLARNVTASIGAISADVGEILIHNAVLSASDRSDQFAYLMDKWGIV